MHRLYLQIQLIPGIGEYPEAYITAKYQSGGEGGIKIADPKKKQTIPPPKERKTIQYKIDNTLQKNEKIPEYSTDALPLYFSNFQF